MMLSSYNELIEKGITNQIRLSSQDLLNLIVMAAPPPEVGKG